MGVYMLHRSKSIFPYLPKAVSSLPRTPQAGASFPSSVFVQAVPPDPWGRLAASPEIRSAATTYYLLALGPQAEINRQSVRKT
jgi:hypothetical protein